MKKIILVGAILSTVLASAQQGIGTNLPDKSSALELRSTKRGLLIPRVPLQATNVKNPVASPANSLLVYNTETAATGTPEAVTPGYYYWSETGTKWVRLINDADLATVATEAATKSKETVSGTGVVKVVGSGNVDDPNRNFAVSIEPAAGASPKILKSNNGTVEWGDAPSVTATTLNTIEGTGKIVSTMNSSDWGTPGQVFAIAQETANDIVLPDPALYAGKIISVVNVGGSPANYVSTYSPANNSTLYSGHGHLLMSIGKQTSSGITYKWYVIGGGY